MCWLPARGRLLAAVREAGYPLATVTLPPAVVHLDQDQLDVAFDVESGPRADLARIDFSGLRHLTEAYLRRRLTLHPGELFRPSAINAAQTDLASIPAVAAVRIEPARQLDPNGEPAARRRGDRAAAARGGNWRGLFDRYRRQGPQHVVDQPRPVRRGGATHPDRFGAVGRRRDHPTGLPGGRRVHQAGLSAARPDAGRQREGGRSAPAGLRSSRVVRAGRAHAEAVAALVRGVWSAGGTGADRSGRSDPPL